MRTIEELDLEIAQGIVTKNEEKSIFYYVCQGDIQQVENFIRSGGDVNLRNERGITLLSKASAANQLDIVDLLLKNKADVNEINCCNGAPTAFLYSAYSASLPILKRLKQSGAHVNPNKNNIPSALEISAKKGRLDVVRWLMSESRASFSVEDIENAYFEAAMNNHLEVMLCLEERGHYQLSYENKDNYLNMAALRGHLPVVEHLVQNGANVNAKDPIGKTPLLYACTYNRKSTIRFLLKNNAHPDEILNYQMNLHGLWDNNTELKDSTLNKLCCRDGNYYENIPNVTGRSLRRPYHPELEELRECTDATSALKVTHKIANKEKLSAAREIIFQISRIEASEYGEDSIKNEKIASLNQLVDALIDETASSLVEIINNWKGSKTSNSGIDNWTLCKTHRRNPSSVKFFGKLIEIYNRNHATKIEEIINNFMENDNSNKSSLK